MMTHQNGDKVSYGMYCSMWPLDVRFVGSDGESLAGRDGALYRRIPTPLAVILSPVFGGLFVIAFPLVIFAGIAVALYNLATRGAREAADQHAWMAQSRFQPAASYLKGSDDGEHASPEGDEDLAQLNAEVKDRRERE